MRLWEQETLMYNYTTKDGIPGTEVFDVIQDERGYIWMATNNGLCKFNGNRFQSYYTKDGLPDNSVIDFYKDQSGRIWMLTYKNQIAYLKGDSIIPYEFNDKLKSFEKTQTYCIESFAVYNNDLYFGMFAKAIIKISSSGQIELLNEIKIGDLFLFEYPKDQLIYSEYHPGMLNHLTKVSLKDTSFEFDLKGRFVTYNSKTKFIKKGDYLIGAYGENLLFFKNNKLVKEIQLKSIVSNLKFDNSGKLMVGTFNNGLYIYSLSKNQISLKYHFLDGYTVTSAFSDITNGYWIPTYNNGVFYIPSTEFKALRDEHALGNLYISNLSVGKDELWYSSIQGHVGYINKNETKYKDLSNINSFKISNIYFDHSENKLWGGFDGGFYCVFKLDKTKQKFYKRSDFPVEGGEANPRANISVKRIYVDSNTLIIGSSHTLYIISKRKQDRFDNKAKTKHTVSANVIEYDKINDQIWFGNRDGLHIYKNDSIIFNPYENRLTKKRVIELKYDERIEELWVATRDSGIYVLKNNVLQAINESNGLSSNNVTAFCIKDDKIWVGTTNGLDKITLFETSKLSYDIQHFNENNGIISNIINDIEVMDSTVYIATDKGISFFNFEKVKKNLSSPPIYITGIKINTKDTILQKSYILNNNENTIDLYFDGLSYRAPKEIKFQYQLVGLHKDIRTTNENHLEFSMLAPGSYTLKISTINEDGILSKDPAVIDFKIKPPFYVTWWFISLSALFLILISGLFFRVVYKVRLKEIKKRNKVEKQLVKERQKALGQQMNPHFIFNTLSSIQFYLYKKDRISSSVYLEKFSQLMRNTLYNSQKEFISIRDEINSLKTYLELEQLRLDHKFKFDFTIDTALDTDLIIPCFLIQPYAENAVWHGISHLKKEGSLSIELQLSNDYLICKIEDNGIGRALSYEINRKKRKGHTSLGTKITETRLDLINTLYKKEMKLRYIDKTDKNGKPTGTIVILSIPVFEE